MTKPLSFSLYLLLLICTLFSCDLFKYSSSNDGVVKPVPEKIVHLKKNELKAITFNWDLNTIPNIKAKENFLLYEVINIDTSSKERNVKFKLIYKEKIKTKNKITIPDNIIKQNKNYIWSLGEKYKVNTDVQNSFYLSTHEEKSEEFVMYGLVLGPPCKGGYWHDYYEYDSIIDSCVYTGGWKCPENKVHYVTLHGNTIISNGTSQQFLIEDHSEPPLANPDSLELGVTCLPFDTLISLKTTFFVNVPCDSIHLVESTPINVLLFSDEDIVPNYVVDYWLNDNYEGNNLIIDEGDYIGGCDYHGNSICRAKIQVLTNFQLSSSLIVEPSSNCFSFVFEVGDFNDHLHYMNPRDILIASDLIKLNKSTDLTPIEEKALNEIRNISHSHSFKNHENNHSHSRLISRSGDCRSVNTNRSKLSYFTCRDGLDSEHISNHYDIITIPCCTNSE